MNGQASLLTLRRWSRLALASLLLPCVLPAQIVSVGSGSYTTALPAGATAPQAAIYRTTTGPVPTHKFWTAKYWAAAQTFSNGGGYAMFPQPLSIQTLPTGLALGYFGSVVNNGTWFIKPYQQDMVLGTPGLNAGIVNVSGSSDWAVNFNWGALTTTVGRGMPFVYATTTGSAITITFSGAPTIVTNNGNVLGVSIAGNNYGLYGPTGATWSTFGTLFTCNLPSGKGYFSLAILPSAAALTEYGAYAYSFPTNTQASWNYNASAATVTTTYAVTTTAKEGSQSGIVMALYPHHYNSGVTANTGYTYASPKGPLKVHKAASFTTTDVYHGVIPCLPPVGAYNAATMQSYLDAVTNEGNHFTYGETYGMGKQLARIAHVMPVAKALGTTASLSALAGYKSSLQSKLQSWFTASSGKTSDLFYYNSNWGTLIGYPGSYGSDASLNDHHFHYGYWIHAAAILGFMDPDWAATSNWGGMVNLLAGDIATPTRGNAQFPFLRHFDIYGGHSWAAGQAPFGDGGNEESSSEAMNAWTGLILWASESGNTALRDAAIWAYTLEANAVMYYWFNSGPTSTFPSGFGRVQVANVFDAKSDSATWFGANPEYEHGIEFLPFTGGSNYLGRNVAYCRTNMNEVLSLTGQSAINPAVTLWPDLMEMYEAFYDPAAALSQWQSTTSVFDGETKAHEYYWLTGMQALGNVDFAVTANTPLYAVYRNAAGTRTHVAYNPSSSATSVTFSDGAVLTVPAGALASDTTVLTLGAGSTNSLSLDKSSLALAATASTGAVAVSSNVSWTVANPATSWLTVAPMSGTNNGTLTFTATANSGTADRSAAVSVSGSGITATVTVTQTGTGGTNIAQGKAVTASTVENASFPAANAVDGSLATRWSSAFSDPQWITVDLGASYQITKVVLAWEAAYGRSYQIQVSPDNTTFSSIYTTTTGAGGTESLTVSGTGRYVRMYGTARGTVYGYSLWEFQIYGTPVVTPTLPTAPSNLTASVASSSQINLAWTASSTSGVTYSVFRSTSAGFTASSSNQIASGVSATTYSSTGLAASTTYYFLVQAVNAAGSSPSSNQASATTSAIVTTTVYINAGGAATGSFAADKFFSGGSTAATTAAINTSLVPSPVPPQAVFQTERYGACSYTITGLTAGKGYTAALYFAEFYWTASNQRTFNVLINGQQVLTNFDIIANAGAARKALAQFFTATANSSGQIVIQLTVGTKDLPKISGIGIY